MNSYTAPNYSSVNMTLCNGYTPPNYNSINFTLGDSDACAAVNTCTYSSGNWTVKCSDVCNITSNVNLGNNWLIVSNESGNGNLNIKSNITNVVGVVKWNGCNVTIFKDIGGINTSPTGGGRGY